jgi:hypothetical protein
MLETDPIDQAQRSLASVCLEVLRGGDPNRLKGPTCALLRAKGQGKQAREIEQLPPLPWTKPKRTP